MSGAGCSRLRLRRRRGFTIVELISVVVLLSILGMFAMGRMVSPTLFAPAIVTQTLVAEVRYAQQLAAARHDAVVSVTLDRVAADWRVRTSSDVDGVLRTQLIDAAGTTVTAASGAVSGGIDASSALTLSFDHAGDLALVIIGAAPGVPAEGVSLSVSGDTSRQICIYPSGYANDSACGV